MAEQLELNIGAFAAAFEGSKTDREFKVVVIGTIEDVKDESILVMNNVGGLNTRKSR